MRRSSERSARVKLDHLGRAALPRQHGRAVGAADAVGFLREGDDRGCDPSRDQHGQRERDQRGRRAPIARMVFADAIAAASATLVGWLAVTIQFSPDIRDDRCRHGTRSACAVRP